MAEYVEIEDLEVGDIFYVNKEWGFCEIKEITGFSFYTGRICFGLEPTDLSKPKRYFEMHFKLDKKVRLFK